MITRKLHITILSVVLLAAVAAYAAITFHTGPSFSIENFDLVTTGDLSGLGGAATVIVTASGFGSGNCINPGDNQPPAWENIPLTASGSQTVHPRAGRASVDVTSAPSFANPCHRHWTPVLTSITYTSARIQVIASGSQVFDQTYSLAGSNGTGTCTATSPATVQCTVQ